MFTGKGGVGKTTVAAAFAQSCARMGKRTLLMQINAKDKVGAMFGVDRIGDEITQISDDLYAVAATPKSAMREYALMTLRVKVIYKAVFENKIIRAFLRAIPGINELVLLGKAYFHTIVETEGDHLKWDMVVVDAPATGHGIFFLQIPGVITSILSSGPMYDEAQNMLDTIRNPSITSINIVTLAEDLPVNESVMLFETATGELEVPVDYVIVNRVLAPIFSPQERQVFEVTHQTGDSIVDGLIDAARFRAHRIAMQDKYIAEVKERIPRPSIQIPFRFEPVMREEALNDFGDILRREVEK